MINSNHCAKVSVVVYLCQMNSLEFQPRLNLIKIHVQIASNKVIRSREEFLGQFHAETYTEVFLISNARHNFKKADIFNKVLEPDAAQQTIYSSTRP